MTISLPYLFVAGCIAAPFGGLMVVLHLFFGPPGAMRFGAVGGVLSLAVQQSILLLIGQQFMGMYLPLSVAMAFLAGYFVFGLLHLLAQGMRALRRYNKATSATVPEPACQVWPP